MRIIVVLLLASLMCCKNAAESRKTPVDGGETEQNPNNPKYQKMAEEIVYNDLRLKNRDVNKITVLKVTTAVGPRRVTRIKFTILFYTGRTETCDSETLEQPWKKVKHVTFTCAPAPPESPEYPDGKHPTGFIDYERLGKESVKKYFKKGNDVLVNTKAAATVVKTTWLRLSIAYVKVDVTTRSSKRYICSVVFVVPHKDSQSTECIEDLPMPGGDYWADPSKKEYLGFAEKSLLKLGFKIKHDTIVTFVKQQVVAGFMTTVYFHVNTIDKMAYKCQARVWDKPSGQIIIEDVKCPGIPNDDPDKAKYRELGKASVEDYIKKHPENGHIRENRFTNIVYVTTRVYKQTIVYVKFDLLLSSSISMTCSVVFVQPIDVPLSVRCFTNKHLHGGYEWVDPSIAKYVDLAEKSLLSSKSIKLKLSVKGHDTIVTFVLRQVVEGYKYAINFIIRPVDDHDYECLSHVWEQLTGHALITDVDCKLRPNSSDDDLAKYERLGEAAVRDYIMNQPNKEHDIKDINIKNTVYETTRVYHKKILYINYDAIMNPTLKNTCSVVFDIPSNSPLNTKCFEYEEGDVGGGWADPSEKKYLDIAEQAGVFDLQKHDTIVTFVTYRTIAGGGADIDFIARPVNDQEYECTTLVQDTDEPEHIYWNLSYRLRENSSKVTSFKNS